MARAECFRARWFVAPQLVPLLEVQLVCFLIETYMLFIYSFLSSTGEGRVEARERW